MNTLTNLIIQIAFIAVAIFPAQNSIAHADVYICIEKGEKTISTKPCPNAATTQNNVPSPKQERAWKAFYKAPDECKGMKTNVSLITRCMEHRQRERAKFNVMWDSDKDQNITSPEAITQKQAKNSPLSGLTDHVVGLLIKMGAWVVGAILLYALAIFLLKRYGNIQSGNHWGSGQSKTGWLDRLIPKYMDRFKLLDTWETDLYVKLTSIMPGLIVFAQVSLPQMLYIKGAHARQQMRQIGHMSVDFLICRKDGNDIKMIAAIELNGASHTRADRQQADALKEKVLEEAGIPLIVYDVENMPDAETIKKHVATALIARKQYEAERDARCGKNK
ncbi:MAG: DUF2726 domain-containing protein [Zoogloeaceae bacterium]|nr:DUF2726 domain-containing protein [Zoogloeaceae bacterium]